MILRVSLISFATSIWIVPFFNFHIGVKKLILNEPIVLAYYQLFLLILSLNLLAF